MAPFDPVRDAVLNSPIHPNLQLPDIRRATDLAVLLNAQPSPPPSFPSTSTSSPTPPSESPSRPRSSTLAHILHPVHHSPPSSTRPHPPRISTLIHHSPHTPTATTTRPSPPPLSASSPPSSPSPTHSRQSAPSLSVSVSPKMSPASAALAALSATRSPVPYAPRKRRTAPASVLVPLTPEELMVYRTAARNPLRDRKRKREDDAEDTPHVDDVSEPPAKRPRDAALVVQHYNARPDVGITQRQQSPIVGLRYFNNWVKSVLIARFAHPALKAAGGGKVLDMGCGKGGDLNKWQKANVREYFGLDIAAVSIEQARSRYSSSSRPNQSRMHQPPFSATFATLDCYTSPLTAALPPSALPPQAPPFDVVSMQFCMHYAFESERKARCMLDNVSRWMRRGGVFVGTIPNDELLLARLDALPPDQQDLEFGNAVYKICFDDRAHRPTYGHRYWFYLTDAVENVPEYVVYWDNFIKLAAEYDLHPLYKAEFHDVFAEHNEHPEFKPLLERMHVVDKNGESQMDEEQWEASNVYIGFAFEKR